MSKLEAYVDVMERILGGVRTVLTPQYRFGEPIEAIARLERIRAIGGIAISISVGVLCRPVNMDTVNGALESVMTSALFALPAVVVGMIVIITATHRESRREVLQSLTVPGLTILGVVATTCVIWFVVRPAMKIAFHAPGMFGAILGVLLILAMAIPTIFYALYLCARNWFNAADAHPLLPAVASIFFAALTLGHDVYLLATAGLDPYIPAFLAFLVTFGGPPTIMAVAVLEIKQSRKCGISLGELPAKRL